MSTIKIITTDQLAKAIGEAISYKLNRQLHPDILKKVDKSGFHVVSAVLPYHNGRDQETPHHRCVVLIKTPGTDVPLEAFLDIAESTFDTFTDSIPVMEKIARTSQYIVKEALNVG